MQRKGISEEELARQERERQRLAAEAAAATAAHLPDVYFDFDSYIIRNQDVPMLKNMAGWLSKNQSVKVVVEGYCDERGTTEYNLALGQKRAEAAKDFLVKSGVSREQDKDQLIRQRGAGGSGPYRRSLGKKQA